MAHRTKRALAAIALLVGSIASGNSLSEVVIAGGHGRMDCSVGGPISKNQLTLRWHTALNSRAVIANSRIVRGYRSDSGNDDRLVPRGTVFDRDGQILWTDFQPWSDKWPAVLKVTFWATGGIVADEERDRLYTCMVSTMPMPNLSAIVAGATALEKAIKDSKSQECRRLGGRLGHEVSVFDNPPAPPQDVPLEVRENIRRDHRRLAAERMLDLLAESDWKKCTQ